MLVETSAEILAKKLWHRAASFPARDLFDFAAVATFEPAALRGIGGVLRARRAVLLERLRDRDEALREDFAALHAWEFHLGFDECVAALRTALFHSSPPPILEQERCPYGIALEPVSGTFGPRYRSAERRYSTTGVAFCDETKMTASVIATTSCSSPDLLGPVVDVAGQARALLEAHH